MDRVGKFLRKLSKRERRTLLGVIRQIEAGNHETLDCKKLRGSHFVRVRKGRFRIIFFYNKNGVAMITDVRYRDDATYKGL